MNPRPEDVDALARAIDRVVFAETGGPPRPETQSASLALISYLNDSFPRIGVAAGRRERLQRRLNRALRVPSTPPSPGCLPPEAGMYLRLRTPDPRRQTALASA